MRRFTIKGSIIGGILLVVTAVILGEFAGLTLRIEQSLIITGAVLIIIGYLLNKLGWIPPRDREK